MLQSKFHPSHRSIDRINTSAIRELIYYQPHSVIVATGLSALVDDCIKRKFHKKKTVHMMLPIPMVNSPLKMKMEYVGPRRLIDEVFNRRPTLSRSQSTQSNRSPIPIRTRTG